MCAETLNPDKLSEDDQCEGKFYQEKYPIGPYNSFFIMCQRMGGLHSANA